MTVFTIKDGVVRIGSRTVLENVNLEVARSTPLALVGPNGAGKSTLLRVMSGLAPLAGGTMTAFEEPRTSNGEPGDRVGILLQNPYLFKTNVARNVGWGLKQKGFSGWDLDKRVETALAKVGLEGFGPRQAHLLSGGEMQRVALARALALEPEALLLDEPTGHLDEESQLKVARIIEDLIEEGVAIVIATHDLDLAERLGGDVMECSKGGVLPQPPGNVFKELVSGGEIGATTCKNGELFGVDITPETRRAAVGSRKVALSLVRYESSVRNQWEGTVSSIVELSHLGECIVTVDCPQSVKAAISLGSLESLGLKVGDPAVVSFKAASVRGF